MKKKAKVQNPFNGHWRIVSMSLFDDEDLSVEREPFVEIGDDRCQFHFGYVEGEMDVRFTDRGGEPAAEWSWRGNDEMEPAQGRGWAVIKDDELHGMFYFHLGDESQFVAKLLEVDKARRKGRKTK